LSRAVLRRLLEIFSAVPSDDLACVLLRGAGERYFAAGGDLRDLASVRTDAQARQMAAEARAALDAIRAFPLPVIAYVNGDALGGGAELAVACDLRIMRAEAQIGFIQGRLAITSAWGGGVDLATLIGPARALRMTTRCELIPATLAMEWGLADAVAPEHAPDQAVRDFMAPILKQAPAVLRGFKALSAAARRGAGYDERRALEQQHFAATWTNEAHWAAVERLFDRIKSPMDGSLQ
jgi:enoyl-CoA hydratase/carnithine racemase